ncbi:MAG: diacylglycerol kinase family protein [Syntrophomonadaceae bacterium]|nr:diacylglycerol kinase family protein [Syntrophomonadaceae bacterium]
MGRLRRSFSCAIAGLIYCIKNEKNMKIHILATILVVIVALVVGLNPIEWGLLILTVFMVLVAETINTAVEKTVDLVTAEYHPLARLAKNLAAGAVLLAAIGSLLMAVVIFGSHF